MNETNLKREFYGKIDWKKNVQKNIILRKGNFIEYYSKKTKKNRISFQERANFTRFEEKKAKELEKSQNKILKRKSFEE